MSFGWVEKRETKGRLSKSLVVLLQCWTDLHSASYCITLGSDFTS